MQEKEIAQTRISVPLQVLVLQSVISFYIIEQHVYVFQSYHFLFYVKF